MLALIEAGDGALLAAKEIAADPLAIRETLPTARLLAPIPLPPQIRDFSLFPQHLIGASAGMARLAARLAGAPPPCTNGPAEIPEVFRSRPIYYITNRFSLVGQDAQIRWPAYSHYLDFELEIAMVLKRGGRNIPREAAREHIFGYTIYNDFSARDTQSAEMQSMFGPTKGKSFDTGNAFGPWIVTADELPDPTALSVEARVNGETWCRGHTADMLHSFEELIAFVSRDETLHAGEIFGSGTVGGCCGLELDRFLSPGAAVELEVEGIGVLRNRLVGP